MNARMWAVFAVVAVAYGAVSIARNWRRERALTVQCRADEQAKTEALLRQTIDGHN
ncbi:hypothetical protein [Streptomyces sp. SDr-06]|uniref:hypothetical protein n=1 Tax=Streptomyces sp. SDr-06 TaxID=2267702 RepID=UPI00167B9BC7|nr:hypothetical protein [Streptomyces sp. SDr-06]